MLSIDFPKLKINSTFADLVQKFPLVQITSKNHHKSALTVLESVMIAKMDSELLATEKRGLDQYFQTLSLLIKDYEDKHYQIEKSSQAEILAFILEINGLTQDELKEEIGAQPAVSRIVRGERKLTPKHIKNLCKRFNLSADIFLSVDC